MIESSHWNDFICYSSGQNIFAFLGGIRIRFTLLERVYPTYSRELRIDDDEQNGHIAASISITCYGMFYDQ